MSQPSHRETDSAAYAQEMEAVAGARWKRVLNVQAPYRWNVRRLARGRVLDVGCGIGRNLGSLADGVGVDHNVDSVAVARRRGLRAWTTQEWPECADALPARYDTLLVAHVLEHLTQADGESLIDAYLPFLKADARLLFICPQEAGFRIDPVTHIRFVTGADLAVHARAVGFEPTANFSFPLPRAAGRFFRYNEFVMVAERSGATGS